jgi:hypothetical protein
MLQIIRFVLLFNYLWYNQSSLLGEFFHFSVSCRCYDIDFISDGYAQTIRLKSIESIYKDKVGNLKNRGFCLISSLEQ